MFRILCAIAALFAAMAVSTANAQPKVCKKVSVSFACRNGGSGTVTLNCRGGETEAQCCARLRKRAADPRRGFCTGRGNSLISFKCGCAKGGGGGGDALPGGPAPLERLAPAEGSGAPAAGDGRLRIHGQHDIDPSSKAPRACRQVKYKFSCRGSGGASGKAACRPGEKRAACCQRVARLARESCRRHGGVAKFSCDCARGAKGALRGGPKDGRLLRRDRGRQDDRFGRRPNRQRKSCARVKFNYSCRGRRQEGGRECRRNETERECCAHAQAVESRKCGAVPSRWKCGCVGDRSRPDRDGSGRFGQDR